jgi:hypothetical protein
MRSTPYVAPVLPRTPVALADVPVLLEQVVRKYRRLLRDTAAMHLDGDREAACDIVKEVCDDALEDRLEMSFDVKTAKGALLAEVVRRAEAA